MPCTRRNGLGATASSSLVVLLITLLAILGGQTRAAAQPATCDEATCQAQGDECRIGHCNEDLGECYFVDADNGTPCRDDGNVCTRDSCLAGACQHTPANGLPCGETTCTDTGREYGGGACTVTELVCWDSQCVVDETTFVDTCTAHSDSDWVSVEFYACVDNWCVRRENTRADSCNDDGSDLGGGRCNAANWYCDGNEARQAYSEHQGTDYCASADQDHPHVRYYECGARDGTMDDSCIDEPGDPKTDSCEDSGTSYGGGTCTASDWACVREAGEPAELVKTTSGGSDHCTNDSTDAVPQVAYYVCVDRDDGHVPDRCEYRSAREQDSCEDSGSDLGGGRCTADDWTCAGTPGRLQKVHSSGWDACGGTPDDPSIRYYFCDADNNECEYARTTQHDNCTDTGDATGGGTCSAMDWQCQETPGEPDVLSHRSFVRADGCHGRDTVVAWECQVGDGTVADACGSSWNTCPGPAPPNECEEGICDASEPYEPATCVIADRTAGWPCGNPTDTACTDPDTCLEGECQANNEPCSMVTDSELCPFDMVEDRVCSAGGTCVEDASGARGEWCDLGTPECPDGWTCKQVNQFRLVFTPDATLWPAYKLNGSNPGQMYYNLMAQGQSEVTIRVPWPYVTQGAMPVHIYEGAALQFTPDGCFAPGEGLGVPAVITLANWIYGTGTQGEPGVYCPAVIGPNGIGNFCEITLTLPGTAEYYVNVHLDYGLKGPWVDANPYDTWADRYDGLYRPAVGTDAYVNVAPGDVLTDLAIPDCAMYVFSDTGSSKADAAYSVNEFKRITGVYDSVYTSANGRQGVAGVTGTLKNSAGRVVATAVGDADGYLMLNYKHTGKAATFTVTLDIPGVGVRSKGVTLKANGWAEASYDVSTGTWTTQVSGNVK